MTLPILYALLMLALATVAGTFSYRGLVALRARRRAAWELDRDEWRRWLTRV
jgi:cell division protein FtsL